MLPPCQRGAGGDLRSSAVGLFHREPLWRFPHRMPPPHFLKRPLQVARKTRRVEQRQAFMLRFKVRAQDPQFIRQRGQPHCSLFVILQAGASQLWQSRRSDQAGSNPRCKCVLRAGQHRHAGPQGIAGAGVGIDPQRVEYKVGNFRR